MITPNKRTDSSPKLLNVPLKATLRNLDRHFEVQCELTGRWLSSEMNTFGLRPGKEQAEWKEKLKKVEYQYHKFKEENGILWITYPVGFWLKDGRLVSECNKEESVEPYYGKKAEIVGKREIQFISDGPHTFSPLRSNL